MITSSMGLARLLLLANISSPRGSIEWGLCGTPPGHHTGICTSDTGRSNLCQSKGSVYWIEDGKICASEVLCDRGKYIDEFCECTLDWTDCYHMPEDCHVPKNYTSLVNTCKEQDWEESKPRYCSIGKQAPGCSSTSTSEVLSFVVDSRGSLRYLSALSIQWGQQYNVENCYLFVESSRTQEFTGTRPYCKETQQGQGCYTRMAKGVEYRGYLHDSNVPYVHLAGCSSEVKCFGQREEIVYHYPSNLETTECTTCSATCTKKEVHFVTEIKGKKTVTFCGKYSCETQESDSKMVSLKRDPSSMMFDDRVKISFYNEDKSISWQRYVDCKKSNVCSVIDCFFCRLRWMNYQCYQWYDWIILLIICYLIMIVLATTMYVAKPIWSCAVWCWWLVIYLGWKMGGCCAKRCGKMKRSGDKIMYTPLTTYAETTKPVNVKSYSDWRIKTIVIVALIVPAYCLDGPCTSMTVTNFNTDTCSVAGNKISCKPSTLSKVGLTSSDSVSCLVLMSEEGDKLGQITVRPTDVSYTCTPEILYYTKDYDIKSDVVTHCPHAADCTVSWCKSVNKDTRIPDFGAISSSFEQFCLLGEACAGHGCFYCTSSCSTFRVYPKQRTPEVYMVARCQIWKPSAVIHVTMNLKNTTTDVTTVISLVSGETKTIGQGVSMTLDLSISDHVRLLSQDVIVGNNRAAITEAAHAGQPIAGEIGQVQCTTTAKANEDKCDMAPNMCVCKTGGGEASCQCSQVYVNSSFTSETTLPVKVGEATLYQEREQLKLKVPSYGTGYISIKTVGKLEGLVRKKSKCSMEFISLSGCYSCISGSKLKYRCMSSNDYEYHLKCGSSSSIVECGNNGGEKEAYLQFPTALVDVNCEVECSDSKIRIQGHLDFVEHPSINENSNIIIKPSNRESNWNWFSNIWWFLGTWNIIWISGGLILILIVLILMYRFLRPQKWKRT